VQSQNVVGCDVCVTPVIVDQITGHFCFVLYFDNAGNFRWIYLFIVCHRRASTKSSSEFPWWWCVQFFSLLKSSHCLYNGFCRSQCICNVRMSSTTADLLGFFILLEICKSLLEIVWQCSTALSLMLPTILLLKKYPISVGEYQTNTNRQDHYDLSGY